MTRERHARDAFTVDEWLTLRRAMLGAPVLVSMSEGGRADMMSEMLAVSQRVLAARKHPSPLVRELVTIRRFNPGLPSGIPLAEVERRVLEALRSANAAVTAKAPEEAPAFRDFVIALIEAAARANREGGMLGMGGVEISPAEEVAIAKVKGALGVHQHRPDRDERDER